MTRAEGASRRQFLALGWFPFWRPRHIGLAGARFRILRNGHSSRRYLRIHGNEETARQVLERHMQTHEGTAYVIESLTRLVPVILAMERRLLLHPRIPIPRILPLVDR